MLEKMRGGLEKNKFFVIDFSSKIDQKSIKKSRKTTFAAKIDEKALPGTAFWGKSRFLVILRPFFQDFGSILGSPGVIFRLLWQVKFSVIFFIIFLKKIKNSKNKKVAFVS